MEEQQKQQETGCLQPGSCDVPEEARSDVVAGRSCFPPGDWLCLLMDTPIEGRMQMRP